MKVKELIALLQTFDSELDVMYIDDGIYCDIIGCEKLNTYRNSNAITSELKEEKASNMEGAIKLLSKYIADTVFIVTEE